VQDNKKLKVKGVNNHVYPIVFERGNVGLSGGILFEVRSSRFEVLISTLRV
jgi:hypothetical protein